jgi:holo-[acyl-carrier-protein] synthase
MILRTGIDLVRIDRLQSQRPEIRRRFLQRVFTEGELAEVGHSDASLAGRFAAKEAASKMLGSGIGKVRWQDIEIRRGQYGAPELIFHGFALQIADWLGLEKWSVSISHEKDYAVAVVLGIGETGHKE